MLRRAALLSTLLMAVPASAAAQDPTPTPTPGPRIIDVTNSDAVTFILVLGLGLSLVWFGLVFYDRFSASRRLDRLLKLAGSLDAATITAISGAIQKPPAGSHGLTRTTLAFGLLTLVGVVLAALLVSDSDATGDLLKSVVTALVTALTTIIGFYFGAKTATDAAANPDAGATATLVTSEPSDSGSSAPAGSPGR